MILWLIGISGAGKTTLGRRLEQHFQEQGRPVYLLDGDEVRSLFDSDLGYSRADREANIKRIILGAYLLDKVGVTGIVCNISPFEHLRELARAKIPGYNEIYLKKDLQRSIENDVKQMYQNNLGKTEIIGKEIGFDQPLHSDLVIPVDEQTVEESFQTILQYLEQK